MMAGGAVALDVDGNRVDRSHVASGDRLRALMELAMRSSLEQGVDPRDRSLIPAEESFKGLFG